jgi:hypothetical protein
VWQSLLPQNAGFRLSADDSGMQIDGQGGTRREIFVGQSALSFRRDDMEVRSVPQDYGFLSQHFCMDYSNLGHIVYTYFTPICTEFVTFCMTIF